MTSLQHIAFVCPRFSETGTVGGAETLLKSLALRAARAGCRVTMLTTCAVDHFTWANVLPAGRKAFAGMEVEYFPVDPRDTDTFHRVQKAISQGVGVAPEDEGKWIHNSVNSQALYDHLRARGGEYDRIVTGPYLFGLVYHAAQIHPAKTFLVSCLHDEPFAYLGLMRNLFGAVAGCLFNTEPERDLARRIFNLPDHKCHVVGMGLDPFEADPNACARRLGFRQPYVIYSGRRESGKGTPLLTHYLHLFRERTGRDVKLVCTGSGPIEAPPELAPHITDLGFVPDQEKYAAMAGACAFIHPSIYESLGIVLLESFLARTPALVHARCEVLRWQCRQSGAGLWFRHYPDFEEQLRWLLEHDEQRRRMGAAGREYVLRNYAWDRVEARFFAALARVS